MSHFEYGPFTQRANGGVLTSIAVTNTAIIENVNAGVTSVVTHNP